MRNVPHIIIALTACLTVPSFSNGQYTLIAVDRTQVLFAVTSGNSTVVQKSEYDPLKQTVVVSDNGEHTVELLSEPTKRSRDISANEGSSAPQKVHRLSASLAPFVDSRGAVLSPNGKHVVVTSHDRKALLLEHLESGEMEHIVADSGFIVGPWWSWDGSHVLFFTARDITSTQSGGYILRSYNLQTKNTLDLTLPSHKTPLTFYPQLAAMEKWVVFSTNLSDKFSDPRQVYAVDPADPSSLTKIDDTWIISLTSIIDGRAVLMATKDGLFLLQESGGTFVKQKLCDMPETWRGFRFRLSPDSLRVVFLKSGDLVIGDLKTGKLEIVARRFSGDFRWAKSAREP